MPLQLPQAVDIGTKILSGLKLGSAIGQIGQSGREEEKQTQLKAEYETDSKEVFEDPTPSNMARFAAKYPGQAAGFKQSFEILSKEKQQKAISDTSQIYSALLADKPEFAQEMIGDRINAIEAEGGDSSKLQKLSTYIQRDNKAAKGLVGITLASLMGPKNFASTFKTLQEQRFEQEMRPEEIKKRKKELEKLSADLGLTKAQTNKANATTKKLDQETKKIIFELGALEGKTDPESEKTRFDQEDKINKKYVSRTKNFVESKRVYEIIKASGVDESGAGDVSMITSFMKMLDPGSVVRESEFAIAQDTGGLFARLSNTAEKIQTGQLITKKQRKAFLRLADKYMKAAVSHEELVRKDLDKVVKSYGLDAENVFGTIAEEAAEAEVEVAQEAGVEQPVISVDF